MRQPRSSQGQWQPQRTKNEWLASTGEMCRRCSSRTRHGHETRARLPPDAVPPYKTATFPQSSLWARQRWHPCALMNGRGDGRGAKRWEEVGRGGTRTSTHQAPLAPLAPLAPVVPFARSSSSTSRIAHSARPARRPARQPASPQASGPIPRDEGVRLKEALNSTEHLNTLTLSAIYYLLSAICYLLPAT